jgi:Ion channel
MQYKVETMKKSIVKLLVGDHDLSDNLQNELTPLQRKIKNIKAIWNNEHRNDIGLEKILRVMLATSQLFFAGTYIKELFGSKNEIKRNLSIDAFVLFKSFFPLVILYNQWTDNTIVFYIVMWFMVETLLYVPTLIFASDLFNKPRSYGRSMLLLFFNYIEIIFGFAIIYSREAVMNRPFETWFDPIYYSCITSATIGYGDYFPVNTAGKAFVCVQSVILSLFVVLFLNFFSGKIESKGYFGNDQ